MKRDGVTFLKLRLRVNLIYKGTGDSLAFRRKFLFPREVPGWKVTQQPPHRISEELQWLKNKPCWSWDFPLIKRKDLIKDGHPLSFTRANVPTQLPDSGFSRMVGSNKTSLGVIRKLSSQWLSAFVYLFFSSSYNGVEALLSNTKEQKKQLWASEQNEKKKKPSIHSVGGEVSSPTWIFITHVPVGTWLCGVAGSTSVTVIHNGGKQLWAYHFTPLGFSGISSSSITASLDVGQQITQQANEMPTHGTYPTM